MANEKYFLTAEEYDKAEFERNFINHSIIQYKLASELHLTEEIFEIEWLTLANLDRCLKYWLDNAERNTEPRP